MDEQITIPNQPGLGKFRRQGLDKGGKFDGHDGNATQPDPLQARVCKRLPTVCGIQKSKHFVGDVMLWVNVHGLLNNEIVSF